MTKSSERPEAGLAKSKAQAVVPGSAVKVQAAIDEAALLGDLRTLVQSARQRIATAAYSTQTLLCWHMGRRLDREHLQGGRATYGKQILVTVSRELTADYGRGFSYAEIARMIQFAQAFPEETIVVTLSQQLSWSHFHALLPIKDPLARDFYAEMCRIERWDVRTLRQKIGGMLFQRTALSKRPKAGISAEIDGGRSEWAALNAPKFSTALRQLQPQAEQRFHDEGEAQPAAIHKECLSVGREGVGHGQRRDGKRICVTVSRELTADLGWQFEPKLVAQLGKAPT